MATNCRDILWSGAGRYVWGLWNYASALYIAAAKANALDKVESELADFVSATTKASTFSQLPADIY